MGINIKRLFDFSGACFLLVLFALPIMVLSALIKFTSAGPVFYWSDRIGKDNRKFKMPKFRTMRVGTPAVATHLLENPDRYITRIGRLLRRYSLDELPQLYSIAIGEMSFVGPRPALYNQYDLIQMRTAKEIHTLIPGITGWAQVNGRDDLPIPLKVSFDEYYLKNRSFCLDLKTLCMTFDRVLCGKGVKH